MLNYSEYEQIIWSKDFESPAKTLFYENVSHRVHSLTACNVVWDQFMTMLSLSKNCNFLVGHGLVDDAEVNIFWSMQINLKQRNVPWVNFLSHLWTQDLFHKKGFTPSIYCPPTPHWILPLPENLSKLITLPCSNFLISFTNK